MLKIHKKVKKFVQLDPYISMIYVLLSIFGLVMIYSASSYLSLVSFGNSENFLFRQLAFIVMGMTVAMVSISFGRYIFPKERMLQLCFLGLLILLIFVLTQPAIKGAKSWINLRFFNLQPSELGKPLLIWASAYYYSQFKESQSWMELFRFPLGMTAIVLLLILQQPDLGTAAIIFLMMWLMALVTGFSKRAVWISGGLMTLFYSLTFLPISIIEYLPFKPYQIGRFLSFHNPWDDTIGTGYQAVQGFLSLARGGITGTGLATSVQKTGFLPEAHTDFIMAIVGEELGFVTVWSIVCLLFVLILRIFWRGQQCQRLFSRYLCYGVGIFFLVQTSINLGALLGLAPITGVPLPFLSYGGSSYLVSSMAIGLVLFALEYEETQKSQSLTLEEEDHEKITSG